MKPSDFIGHRTGSYGTGKRHKGEPYRRWHDYQPLADEELQSALAYQREILNQKPQQLSLNEQHAIEREVHAQRKAREKRERAKYRKWKAWYEEHKRQQREAKKAERAKRKEANDETICS